MRASEACRMHMDEQPSEPVRVGSNREELWIGAYRCTGRQKLPAADAGLLEQRLKVELRRVRLAHVVSRGLAFSVCVSIGSLFAFWPDPSSAALTVFAALGAMALALGAVGALMEVLFAPVLASRLVFGGAAVAFVAGVCLKSGGVLPALGAIVMLMGGGAMLYLRWKERRSRLPVLLEAIAEVQLGEVDVFEFSDEPAAADGQSCDCQQRSAGDNAARRLEILPVSRLLVRCDAIVPRSLVVMKAVILGLADEGSRTETEDTAAAVTAQGDQDDVRTLTEPESAELLVFERRLRWGSFGQVVFSVWFTAFVLQMFARLFEGRFPNRGSGWIWLLAMALGLCVLLMRLRFHVRLRADANERRVVRLVRQEEGRLRTTEVLRHSRRLWRLDGLPAAWRRVR
jgi:hypothetical protein